MIAQNISSVEEIKSFVEISFPELNDEVSQAASVQCIINVLVKKCNINDVSIVKAIAEHFKITRAASLILEYESKVKKVCSDISVQHSLTQKKQLKYFNNYGALQLVLGWEPDEHSFNDIQHLLEEAFKDLNKRIIVRSIHKGNSILIICYGPHHLLAALFLEAQDNLTVLVKEFGLISLTIGQYTVYDKRIRYKV